MMKYKVLITIFAVGLLISMVKLGNAAIIDFTGGTAYLIDGSSVTTTNTGLWEEIVDYYEEDGVRIDFVGGNGTIGDYYNNSSGIGGYGQSVIHAHDFSEIDIVFSLMDGSVFDLTSIDMTTNAMVGGEFATGSERSFLTTDTGHSMMLAPSDWGLNFTHLGQVGDGNVRHYLNNNFTGITSFTISSENAFCFGMESFSINRPPHSLPEPMSFLLFGSGFACIIGSRLQDKK